MSKTTQSPETKKRQRTAGLLTVYGSAFSVLGMAIDAPLKWPLLVLAIVMLFSAIIYANQKPTHRREITRGIPLPSQGKYLQPLSIVIALVLLVIGIYVAAIG